MLFALEDLSDWRVPEESRSQEIGRRGLVFAQNLVVNNLMWGFYKTDGDDDHGIDATIEPKKANKWTGQLIGVQMKTTNSPISEGDCFVYYVKRKHFEYWTKYSLPVVVFLCDLEKKQCFWAQVSPKTTVKTRKAYKIYIPKSHLLGGRLTDVLLPEIAENGNLLLSKVNIFFRTEELIQTLINNGKVVAEKTNNSSAPYLGGYKYIDFTIFDRNGNYLSNQAFFIPFFKDAKPFQGVNLVDAIEEFLPWASATDINGDVNVDLNQYGRDFWRVKSQLEVK